MRKLFTAIAIVAVSFTAPSAFGENTVSEGREELARLWNPEQAQQVADGETINNFAGMSEAGRVSGTRDGDYLDGRVPGPWEGNFRGGRVHEGPGR